MLATTLGDLDGAARHFEAALELNARLGSPTWLAHTQYAYGRALARRGRGADLARADELLGAALATARATGMEALAERVGAGAPAAVLPDDLSAREVQVLQLVAHGRSNQQYERTK